MVAATACPVPAGVLAPLLGEGWPAGLVEVAGRGRSSLAFSVLAAAREAGQPVAWVDGTGDFCPATAGLDLAELTLVRTAERGAGSSRGARCAPGDARDASGPSAGSASSAGPAGAAGPDRSGEDARAEVMTAPRGRRPRSPAAAARFAADVLLRSRAFALVVLDLPGRGRAGALSEWFRLGRLASRSRSVLLLLHAGSEGAGPGGRRVAHSVTGSASELALSVRLAARPGPPWADLPPPGLVLRVVRHRGAPERQGRELSLPAPGPPRDAG
jgi:hypothetical protein